LEGAEIVALDLADDDGIRRCIREVPDAVIHLAAVSSARYAAGDPGRAWEVNAGGTARLAAALAERAARAILLVVSTGEVYGAGTSRQPRRESDPTLPVSPYAASKLGAEIASLEVWRRTALPVIVARPFAHSGARQGADFAVPAFAQRVLQAKKVDAVAVGVGNLEPIREYMHVSDVVDAYRLLLEHGHPGEVYNVASGQGLSLRDVFFGVVDAVGYRVIPEADSSLVRPVDIPYLVGDATKLAAATGWRPRVSFMEMVREVVNAQAN
jgi:GDP-4-dehydro-6-deoxy-D-mannose reductase